MKEETLKARIQVAKKPVLKKLKDKLLFLSAGALVLWMTFGLIFPSSKAHELREESSKENVQPNLDAHLAYLAQLKAEQKAAEAKLGYQGANPNFPPLLRSAAIQANLSKETLARMNAPSTFYTSTIENNSAEALKGDKSKTLSGTDPNSQFINSQDAIVSVSAKNLPHPLWTVPAGEMIPATLETSIHSALAGMTRAITTRDIYALSGNKLLIPKGSTLVGQFNAQVQQGQSRIFVVWNRLQLSNGIIVNLNSPSSDSLGRSGQAADYIDRHFFERFSQAALLSVLGAYVATGDVSGQDQYNSLSQYRMNIANSFQQSANQSLAQDMKINPTLQINQGTLINVFVAHDLDFYKVAAKV